jgi:hypothetical protein
MHDLHRLKTGNRFIYYLYQFSLLTESIDRRVRKTLVNSEVKGDTWNKRRLYEILMAFLNVVKKKAKRENLFILDRFMVVYCIILQI